MIEIHVSIINILRLQLILSHFVMSVFLYPVEKVCHSGVNARTVFLSTFRSE